ncbi:Alpha/Beta hydrolase protein [Biscogniauxia sp. FL1348]|nr:Alpha/Beta hydrolase protein [Biscogniauxia sp. FL1348]
MPSIDGLPVNESCMPCNHRKPEDDKIPPGQTPETAKDKKESTPSRFSLKVTANWWRSLQCMGIGLHLLAPPRPPNPDIVKSVPSTLSERPGNYSLAFYFPEGYLKNPDSTNWPVVVNYHGGGFTLGSPHDDARFARAVIEKSNAVFVSVGYRLAPEFPFPTAVQDGADAILYIIKNATDLRIDSNRIATSGFSAGGNIAITAPICLNRYKKTAEVPAYRILAVVTWYPITDYTLSRAARRASCNRPDLTLPPTLTNLFDSSYLFPPGLNLADACLSPSKASDEELMESMPPNVFFFTCEWDMLLREGEDLARRLEQPPLSRTVLYTMISGVSHGWDKGPNPIKPPAKSSRLYAECCRRLKKVFEGSDPRSMFERQRRVPPPLPPRKQSNEEK